MTERRPITLITGASAGLGAALAQVFARNGHDLMLVARREQRLVELADAIAAQGRRRPDYLAADLGRGDAAALIGEAMAARGIEPEIVVNNAGFGLVGEAAKLSRSEQLAMIDLNVRALADLSLAFVDSLERHRGGILNVASVAAFMPGPAHGRVLRQQGVRTVAQRSACITSLCRAASAFARCVPVRCRPSFRRAPGSLATPVPTS